jgi:hypothetical protein
MDIACSPSKSWRDAPRHDRSRDARASLPPFIRASRMAFDNRVAKARKTCEKQAENMIDENPLRLDNVDRENRLIHPHCGSSNTER